MRRTPGLEDETDLALAEAAAKLLEAIKAEPVPDAIVVLAQQLQEAIDARLGRPTSRR